MYKELSKNISTQLTKQPSSDLVNRLPIEPVMHLLLSCYQTIKHRYIKQTNLFQHMSVNVWVEDCNLALACSCSTNVFNSR